MEDKTMAELFEKLFTAKSQEDLDKIFGKREREEAQDKNFYYPGLPNGDVTTVGNTGDYALKEARK